MVEIDTPSSVENTTSDTSGKDITNEVEVDKSEVEIFKIEELAPSSAPLTIPYLEIYRTNELEYIPYLSPYNVGVSTSDSDSESDSSDTDLSNTDEENNENTDENNTDENNENGDTSNTDN